MHAEIQPHHISDKPLQSVLNRKGLSQATRIGLILLSNLVFMIAGGRWNILLVSFPITIFIMFGYLHFTFNRRFKQWSFHEEFFRVRPALWGKTEQYNWEDVTAWDERRRLGSASRMEYIPNYTEMAFWINHKQQFVFDELDYANYRQMADYVANRMEAIRLNEAR